MPRELTPQERAAMYVFHERYGAQREGAIEFFAALTPSEKRMIQEMLDECCPKKKKAPTR